MKQTRRGFLRSAGLGAAALGIERLYAAGESGGVIQGFDDTKTSTDTSKKWEQTSERKVRMGIAGYGVCSFGAAFSLQNHPNVEVVAVSDLIPQRCEALARACRCSKTYPSLEEMVKDETIEAIFCATDAPSHARHAILCLNHGKHVATAVPAVFGSLEDAELLFEAVKRSGLVYMLFETSVFHDDVYAMREIYKAGGFGKLVYTEGEYYHFMPEPIPSYKGWRVGLPPLWYPTHSMGYYVGVTGGSFTEVSCMGMPAHPRIEHLQPENNVYKNHFGSEVALLRTSEGGMARMTCSWDTPGWYAEAGRCRGQFGSMNGMNYSGESKNLPDLKKPPLPPGVDPGGHGGSHGYLGHEFVMAILENRRPLVDVVWALNMTVAGVVAHESALRDGELLKIPQYSW